MPSITLSQDDKDWLSMANRPALEWFEKLNPTEPSGRLWSTADFNDVARAFGAMAGGIQSVTNNVRNYARVSNRWGGPDYYERREREVDEGTFVTFGYDWIHGRIQVDTQLEEVFWINHEYDASTGTRDITFRDGSEFCVQEGRGRGRSRFGENLFGFYLGGPMDGQRVSERDHTWMLESVRTGRINRNEFRTRVPLDTTSLYTRREIDTVEMPTFEEARYRAILYLFPTLNATSPRQDQPFLVLVHQP